MVMGAWPRKMPFLAIDLNFAGRLPGGQIHTLHPKSLEASPIFLLFGGHLKGTFSLTL